MRRGAGRSLSALLKTSRGGANTREAFAVPAYTDFLEFNRKAWPEFLLARGRYEEALHAAEELTKSEWPLPRLAGHTLAGEALLAMDRPTGAQEELRLAEQETEHLPVNLVASSPFPSILRAGLLLGDKNIEEAEPLLQEIVKMTLARPGPDGWSAARFELEAIAKTARQSGDWNLRSEEHTSELQSRLHLVCRLLLEKKKKNSTHHTLTP